MGHRAVALGPTAWAASVISRGFDLVVSRVEGACLVVWSSQVVRVRAGALGLVVVVVFDGIWGLCRVVIRGLWWVVCIGWLRFSVFTRRLRLTTLIDVLD
ncbi:MAG: hypothetical protein FWD57_01805 [Polyangiaceae bacterium]|nr:hypothetical protein [Polyangiaceae bacterium]